MSISLLCRLFLEENAPGVSFNLRINAGQPAVSVLNLFCKFIDYFEDNPVRAVLIPSTIYQLLFHLAYNWCVQSFLRSASVSDGCRQWFNS